MTGKRGRGNPDLTLMLKWEFLITDDTGHSRAGGVCEQYLISVPLTAITQITPKHITVSLYPLYNQGIMSNSSCYVLKHRHILLWKHNHGIIALEITIIL